MGTCFPRSSTTKAGKVVKILKRPDENESKAFENVKRIQIKKVSVKKAKKKNYFYVIQRNAWKIVIDFLPYKDLNQAGRVNR